MAFNFKKYLIKPKNVAKKEAGIYFVILFISILGLITTSVLFLLALYTKNPQLAFLNLFGFFNSLYVFHINRKGQHIIAIGLFCTSLYIFAIIGTILFGWSSGFQYYLIPLTTLLFLHPKLNSQYLIAFGLFPFITFMLLTQFNSQALEELGSFYTFLHGFNAFNVFLALAFINYYFRTDVFRLLTNLDRTAKTDMLTGLMNRRSMTLELTRHCNLTERYENSSSLLLIDIDNFKLINDRLGHLAGDTVLKQFSKLLTQRLRETDLLARWGGDEFLVLAPFTDIKSATELAENLRKSIQKHDFSFENRILNLSITIGVNEIVPNLTMEDSLKKVDKLLYQGKGNQRNQVVSEQIATHNN